MRRGRILAMPSIFDRGRFSDQRLASQTYSVGSESRPTSAHILAILENGLFRYPDQNTHPQLFP